MASSNNSIGKSKVLPLVSAGLAALIALSMGPSPAHADEFPESELYIGAFGGGILGLRQWDLGSVSNKDTRYAESGFLGGLRVGYHLKSKLAFEFSGSFNRISAKGADDTNTFNFNIGALYHLTGAKWAPYVAGGVGIFRAQGGGLGSDTDAAMHVGVGFRGMLTPKLALRIEAKDFISDEFVDGGSHNLQITVGLDFFPSVKSKVTDRDKDGIADGDDACPDKPGSKTTKGCPDRDNDGIADSDDKCPDKSGKKEFGGCPDTDGDGIADNDDKCPAKAGPKETGGCPDSDKDGLADNVDKCPNKPGKKEFGGCPDTDGDGIADGDDKCPNKAGKKELAGCPDRDNDTVADSADKCPDVAGKPELAGCPDGDNDGVADADDKCPKVRGLKSHQGCLPVAVKKFAGAIRGIRFLLGKATIQRRSYGTLNRAVKVMKDFPSLTLRIEGHTDSRGSDEKNQALSENRANSVRAYLVSKGIAESRLTTKGLGESKPVKKNNTAAGRNANRRIEFIITGG